MPRPPYRSELVGAERLWLVELRLASRTIRLASRPIVITNADGDALAYDGALSGGGLSVETSVDLPGTTPDTRRATVQASLPVDVAKLAAYGHDLHAATCEIARIVVGNTYEDREIVLSGAVVQPSYGALGEALRFGVEQQTINDTALIPQAAARVSLSAWPTRPLDDDGLYYPLPLGEPGAYVDSAGVSRTTSGSPALRVEMTGSNVDTLLIADGWVDAGTVKIYDSSTEESFGTSRTTDGNGRRCTTVDVSSAGTISRTEDEYWVGWSNGGALYNERRDGALAGAGEIIEWALRQSSVRFDAGRFRAARLALDRYRLAGFIDDAVSPWEWLVDKILPLLPVALRQGPDGVWPFVYPLDARGRDAVATITAGDGAFRTGPVQYEGRVSDIVNEVRLSFAPRAKTGAYRRFITVTGAASPEDDDYRSYYATLSRQRYGLSSVTIEAENVYDTATAFQIAHDQIRLRGFLPRVVPYDLAPEYGALREGDVVRVVDSDVYLSEQLAVVYTRSDSPSPLIGARLFLLEDAPRDARYGQATA